MVCGEQLEYDGDMIGKLTGRFEGTVEGMTLIDVGGVGYTVRLPTAGGSAFAPQEGVDIALFIHTAVREDAIDLYGFPTNEELRFFRQLMSVSGIGPKTAIGIMSVADTSTLRRAIAKGDAAALTKTFGIGKKNAERMVVELRDKLSTEVLAHSPEQEASDEVLEALMALGYKAEEARRALKEVDPALDTRNKIAHALRSLGTLR